MILCPIFAALSVLFIVLSVMNFTKDSPENPMKAQAAEYLLSDEAQTDAPAPLAGSPASSLQW